MFIIKILHRKGKEFGGKRWRSSWNSTLNRPPWANSSVSLSLHFLIWKKSQCHDAVGRWLVWATCFLYVTFDLYVQLRSGYYQPQYRLRDRCWERVSSLLTVTPLRRTRGSGVQSWLYQHSQYHLCLDIWPSYACYILQKAYRTYFLEENFWNSSISHYQNTL